MRNVDAFAAAALGDKEIVAKAADKADEADGVVLENRRDADSLVVGGAPAKADTLCRLWRTAPKAADVDLVLTGDATVASVASVAGALVLLLALVGADGGDGRATDERGPDAPAWRAAAAAINAAATSDPDGR